MLAIEDEVTQYLVEHYLAKALNKMCDEHSFVEFDSSMISVDIKKDKAKKINKSKK